MILLDCILHPLASHEKQKAGKFKAKSHPVPQNDGNRILSDNPLMIYDLRFTIWKIPRRWRKLAEQMRSGIFGNTGAVIERKRQEGGGAGLRLFTIYD